MVRPEIQPVFELTYVGHISPVKSRRFDDRPIAGRNLIHCNIRNNILYELTRQEAIVTFSPVVNVKDLGRQSGGYHGITVRPLNMFCGYRNQTYYCPEAGYCVNA